MDVIDEGSESRSVEKEREECEAAKSDLQGTALATTAAAISISSGSFNQQL
jgi:hypothetical protein